MTVKRKCMTPKRLAFHVSWCLKKDQFTWTLPCFPQVVGTIILQQVGTHLKTNCTPNFRTQIWNIVKRSLRSEKTLHGLWVTAINRALQQLRLLLMLKCFGFGPKCFRGFLNSKNPNNLLAKNFFYVVMLFGFGKKKKKEINILWKK